MFNLLSICIQNWEKMLIEPKMCFSNTVNTVFVSKNELVCVVLAFLYIFTYFSRFFPLTFYGAIFKNHFNDSEIGITFGNYKESILLLWQQNLFWVI
jgi:hypothetical protein